MANASIALAMTGEQCQHLVNMFVANHAKKTKNSNLDKTARNIDVCDGKSPDLSREWMRRISKLEQGTTNVEFLYSLSQKTTDSNLLGEVGH